jgi:general stress protein 26
MLAEIEKQLGSLTHPTAFLATVDKSGAPQVRPVTLMCTGKEFYLATSAGSRKASQFTNDNRVEFVVVFCDGENNGYLRVMGRVQPVDDINVRAHVTAATEYPVTKYWLGVDDPDFFFCRILPARVEYMRRGDDAATEVTHEYVD